MTQTTNGIEYPQEPMLLVRPCLIDICARVRPAAKMLSALLYHARGCTDDVFHLYRSQSQLVSDTIDEVCEKTLCDVATPILRILGFIDADANSRTIHYTVYMDRIRQAVSAYKQGVTSLITLLRQSVKATLETVLKSPTLETVLKTLETVLKSPLQHKNQFQCSLEPVLIIFRTSSNVRRGRKPAPQATGEAQSEDTENKRESREIDTRESIENISVTHVTDAAPFRPYAEGHLEIKRDDLETLTIRLMEDVYREQPPQELSTSPPHVDNDNESQSHIATPQATRKKKTKPGELTLQGQHWLDEYQKFKGRKSTPGKATIEAANGLANLVASDEEFTAVLTEIRDNKYLNDNNIARDLDFVFRKYERYRDIVEQKSDKKTERGVRLIGGKPSSELTDMEIDALPTPFLRKAARSARSSPLAF